MFFWRLVEMILGVDSIDINQGQNFRRIMFFKWDNAGFNLLSGCPVCTFLKDGHEIIVLFNSYKPAIASPIVEKDSYTSDAVAIIIVMP